MEITIWTTFDPFAIRTERSLKMKWVYLCHDDSCLKGNLAEGHINWGANMWIKLEFIFAHIIFDSQKAGPARSIHFFLSLKGLNNTGWLKKNEPPKA